MDTTKKYAFGVVSVLAAAVLLLVGGLIVPGVAMAQGESGGGGVSSSKAALIVDASGSMLDADVDGGTRMDAAKRAAHELVNDLPDSANLGLLAYGMRVSNAPEDHERGCQDIETLVPVGKLDRGLLKSKIDEMTPSGYTPIGHSLRAAAEELGDEGERSIILVSDGIDTCAPPPVCEVAKELAGEGFDLTIHTVGFKTDEQARAELECVARVSGGDFLEADDTASLAKSLKFLAQRSAETYQTAGTWFEYADTPEDAKWLGEGRYRTKVKAELQESPGDDVKRGYYKVAIPEGHKAVISTTVLPKRSSSGRAHDAGFVVSRIDAQNETAEKCDGIYGGTSTEMDGGTSGGVSWMPSALIRRFEPVKEERGCSRHWTIPDEIYFTTTDKSQGTAEEDVEVEVVINFEPIPDEDEVYKYPDGEKKEEYKGDLSFDSPQSIKGGTSFSDAMEVKPGTYKDAIVRGEYRFYKIPVEYGQQPVFSYRALESEGDSLGNLSPALYSPFREMIKFESTRPEATLSAGVIQYRNRDVAASGDQQANAGYYYIGLGRPQGDEDAMMGVEQPFEISFDAVGQKADGPNWRPTEKDGPEPSDTPPGEPAVDGKEKPKDSDTQAQDQVDEGGFDAKTMVMVAIGAGIVLLLAALVALIALRRRK
ncbi:vWA domain-containing protein [Corynebacterium meitnerae]|uniref:VWA domain-containing protein n=1 Tax=Corynebacterium meitnerae TaxID=2913498 RepID=A0A9X3LT09_9CORY|nr:VWA domain-containing protein [Corynebacterium meitnerae]MCZ9293537.1 VWA domain-containing protein [Corynebacterium meitnerae]